MTRPCCIRSPDYPDLPAPDDFVDTVDDVAPHRWTKKSSCFRKWLLWAVLHTLPAEVLFQAIQRLRNARLQRDRAQQEVRRLRARVAELEAGRGYR